MKTKIYKFSQGGFDIVFGGNEVWLKDLAGIVGAEEVTDTDELTEESNTNEDANMNTDTTLRDAVRDTVADYMARGQTFSAHTITLAVRDKANNGLKISDVGKRVEGVNVVPDVKHDSVKPIVRDIMRGEGLYQSSSNGLYVSYEPVQSDDADDDDDTLSAGGVLTGNIFDSALKRTTTLPQTPPSIQNFGVAPAAQVPSDSEILSFVERSIRGGVNPTLKSVQSGLKRGNWRNGQTHSVPTETIRRVCEGAGYSVEANTPVALAKISKIR